MQEIKRKLHSTRPTVQIGKSGWEKVLGEVKRQLRQRKVVKVRVLKSARQERRYETATNNLM